MRLYLRGVPVAVSAALFLAVPLVSLGQTTNRSGDERDVALAGVVRTAEGIPLRGARLTLRPRGLPEQKLVADEVGRYAARLPIGAPYQLTVSKPGYAPARFNSPGTRATLAFDVVLTPGGAVTGTVVDRFGDPMVSLSVLVVPADPSRGSEEHVAQTDERGNFRVGSLADGEYTIQLSRAPVRFNAATANLSIPNIEYYLSTMPPAPFLIKGHRDVQLEMHFDAGANRVELGAVAVTSFEDDQARSGVKPPRTDAPGQASIEGFVVDSSGRTVRGAVVDLEPIEGGRSRRTSADADGRYSLAAIAPGRYVIWARRDPFTPKGRGLGRLDESMRRIGQSIDVRPGAPLVVPLTMLRGSAIAGVVLDRFGDPVEGAAVQLRTVRYGSGRPLLTAESSPIVRMTDDRGRYSFSELDAGSYYVSALDGLNEVFYPDRASVAQARAINVDERQDVLNVDLQFQQPPSARIRGRVVTPTDANARTTIVLMESARSGGVVQQRTVESHDGTFEFTQVPAGDYVVQATRGVLEFARLGLDAPSSAGVLAFDAVPVAVAEGAAAEITVSPRPSVVVRGHFQIDGKPAGTIRPPAVRLIAADADNSPPGDFSLSAFLTELPSDGSFTAGPAVGSFRVQLTNAPAGWWLKSAVIGGVDAALFPVTATSERAVSDVELVIATDGATLSGRVTGERGAIARATVLIFSADPEHWFFGSQHVRRVQTALTGRFELASLPPGEYFALAMDDVPADPDLSDWQSPSALSNLTGRATRIRLSPSQRRTLDLKLP